VNGVNAEAARRGDDLALRTRALDILGAAGNPLAREALETGTLGLEPHALSWEGTLGHVSGVRAVLHLPPDLRVRVAQSPGAGDALVAALAAAIALTPGRSLADLVLEGPAPPGGWSPRSPYR
jgi:hypothetical protein